MIFNSGKTLILCILVIGFITGCYNRKNPIGIDDDPSLPSVINLRADTVVDTLFSFADYAGTSFPTNKLLTGSYEGNNSITLLRFANLPDSGFVLLEDAILSLGVSGVHEVEGLNLSLALIQQKWLHNEATWLKADEDTDWEVNWSELSDLELLDGVEYTVTDSLVTFTIPKETFETVVHGWISEEPISYGIAIMSLDNDTDSYLEFNTRDHDNGPRLKFKYLASAEEVDDSEEYDLKAIFNTFINSAVPDDEYNYLYGNIAIRNLPPTRSVMKLNLDAIRQEIAVKEGSTMSEEEMKRITVNRADLILHIDLNLTHFSPSVESIRLRPLILTETITETDLPISNPEMELLLPDYTSLIAKGVDSLRVNITPIMQAYLSGQRESYGMVLVSTSEDKDNTHIQFYGLDYGEEAKRPGLIITYTKNPFPDK